MINFEGEKGSNELHVILLDQLTIIIFCDYTCIHLF